MKGPAKLQGPAGVILTAPPSRLSLAPALGSRACWKRHHRAMRRKSRQETQRISVADEWAECRRPAAVALLALRAVDDFDVPTFHRDDWLHQPSALKASILAEQSVSAVDDESDCRNAEDVIGHRLSAVGADKSLARIREHFSERLHFLPRRWQGARLCRNAVYSVLIAFFND